MSPKHRHSTGCSGGKQGGGGRGDGQEGDGHQSAAEDQYDRAGQSRGPAGASGWAVTSIRAATRENVMWEVGMRRVGHWPLMAIKSKCKSYFSGSQRMGHKSYLTQVHTWYLERRNICQPLGNGALGWRQTLSFRGAPHGCERKRTRPRRRGTILTYQGCSSYTIISARGILRDNTAGKKHCAFRKFAKYCSLFLRIFI